MKTSMDAPPVWEKRDGRGQSARRRPDLRRRGRPFENGHQPATCPTAGSAGMRRRDRPAASLRCRERLRTLPGDRRGDGLDRLAGALAVRAAGLGHVRPAAAALAAERREATRTRSTALNRAGQVVGDGDDGARLVVRRKRRRRRRRRSRGSSCLRRPGPSGPSARRR